MKTSLLAQVERKHIYSSKMKVAVILRNEESAGQMEITTTQCVHEQSANFRLCILGDIAAKKYVFSFLFASPQMMLHSSGQATETKTSPISNDSPKSDGTLI